MKRRSKLTGLCNTAPRHGVIWGQGDSECTVKVSMKRKLENLGFMPGFYASIIYFSVLFNQEIQAPFGFYHK